MNNPVVQTLSLQQVTLDERAQPRSSINKRIVAEYAQEIDRGAVFPPVTVFHDGENFWLADGFHRYHANQRASADVVLAEVHEGTLKDAILFSVGANAKHGFRRTNEDKRRAVRTLLDDPHWRKWSENEIAKRCGVSRSLVAEVKKELETEGGHLAEKQDKVVSFTRRGKPHAMNTGNIGSKSKTSPISSEAISKPDPVSQPEPENESPVADKLTGILCRIYDDFSSLPLAVTAAALIKAHQIDFSAMRASEVSTWFRALAQHLDARSNEPLPRPPSSFPSYHSVMEVQE
jgi:hypothetical protein